MYGLASAHSTLYFVFGITVYFFLSIFSISFFFCVLIYCVYDFDIK